MRRKKKEAEKDGLGERLEKETWEEKRQTILQDRKKREKDEIKGEMEEKRVRVVKYSQP